MREVHSEDRNAARRDVREDQRRSEKTGEKTGRDGQIVPVLGSLKRQWQTVETMEGQT